MLHALVPELNHPAFAHEQASTCAQCPMVARPDGFLPDLRCCTYHPTLENWKVGRILADGGAGARQMLARLANPDGVSDRGVSPPDHWGERYDRLRARFGKESSLRCPYWIEDALSCSIWEHRNGICRTWFCMHDQGARGFERWANLRQAVRHAERAVAAWLLTQANPPDPVGADWFRWCAARVARATPDEIASITADPELLSRRARLQRVLAQPDKWPDYLQPAVTRFEHLDDGRVELEGYSPFNTAIFPSGVFVLLSLLDGQTSWRDALDSAANTLGDAPREWLHELVRLGIVEACDPHAERVGATGTFTMQDDGMRLSLAPET